MAEYGLNLWDYWRVIYKRKWIIISIFMISVISAHFLGEKTIPIYNSRVTLHISTGRTPVAEITGTGVTFWGGSVQNFSTQLALIKSYSILRDVAIKLDMISSDDDEGEEKVQSAVASLRSRINVLEKGDTDLVDITARDTDAVRARNIAKAVAEVFIEKNWEKKVQEARNTKTFVEKQLKKMDANITDIKRKLRILGVEPEATHIGLARVSYGKLDYVARLAQLKFELTNLRERYTDNHPRILNILSEIKNLESNRVVAKKGLIKEEDESEIDIESMDKERLENELVVNKKLYMLLMERYEKARIMEASKSKDIEIVNPAIVPKFSGKIRKTANIFLGGAIGLVLGLMAAFITESLDTSIGTIEDVEEYLRLPVLGVIPQIEVPKVEVSEFLKEAPPSDEKKRYEDIIGKIVFQMGTKSSISEAYRNLQTYIKFSGLDKHGNAIMFTSAGVREGKTLTSVNSAISMAQLGYKTLLVDTDLRRPAVHRIFGIDREIGLTDVVLGTFKLDDVIKTMDDLLMGNIKSSILLKSYGLENLSIITAGHLPGNPTEIISSQNMSNFIKEVKDRFQVVFFDSAPILPVTDSCILSSKVDSVIMVYEVGRVARGALRRSKIQIESAKGNPIGVVLNGMRISDMRFGHPYYYYTYKYYGEDHEKSKKISSKKRSIFRKRPNTG